MTLVWGMGKRTHCAKCGGSDFYKNGKCRPCYSTYLRDYMGRYRAAGKDRHYNRRVGAEGKAWRNTLKRRLLEEMGVSACQRCGFEALAPDHLPAIDFHHRDHADKLFSLSGGSYQRSWEALLAEARKCDVLCANCHRIHHEQNGWVAQKTERRPPRERGSVRSD